MRLVPSSDWVVYSREIRGVVVGGCISRHREYRLPSYTSAHAHIVGLRRGWICFRTHAVLPCRELWLHELAHVITREGHTKNWREFLLQIGGTLDPVYLNGKCVLRSYHPKSRQPAVVPLSQDQWGFL